ncbi:RIFT barrel domain-containing protein [Actinacidiphila bryophytorum]|uniref:RIFT barrel domain-containing protein n=1 Tax=Actinacidiphila bryophytorum TaxID=1436133 RepID=UPI00196116FF|nr:hypothetical protein [Actinacidiphila bryophytorum]MBM9437978.1 hypothetical protein [Actinacidiphila bryophytorum]MBN6542670.1 hypothetical protein [Actinacidiphila bryophytorum]
MAAGTPFALRDSGGDQVPLQSWPLAYWPDGGHELLAAAWLDLVLPAGEPR